MPIEPFTQINNKVLENLCRIKLWPNQTKVLLVIIRKTYGFQKKMDHIAQSQIARITGLDRRHVHRAIQQLMKKGVICRDGKKIGICPDLYEKLASTEMTTDTNVDDKMSSGEMHTIDTNINTYRKSGNSLYKTTKGIRQGLRNYDGRLKQSQQRTDERREGEKKDDEKRREVLNKQAKKLTQDKSMDN